MEREKDGEREGWGGRRMGREKGGEGEGWEKWVCIGPRSRSHAGIGSTSISYTAFIVFPLTSLESGIERSWENA